MLDRNVTEISVHSLNDSLDKFIIFDTREKEEYDISHIQSAIHVGFDNFQIEKISHLDKKVPIVCYCSVGYRSEKIVQQLTAAGFTNVRNLYGSIFEWVNEGYPVYNLQKNRVNTIHVYSSQWGRFITNTSFKKYY